MALARRFITEAIRHGLPLGKGFGPANPMAQLPGPGAPPQT